MARDMYSVYYKMTEYDLRKLRSKKVLQMLKIAKYENHFAMKDKERLADQISKIDAELSRRAAQEPLF